MYQFLCEVPEQTHDDRYQKALCDPDAGVMISALPIYLKLTKVSRVTRLVYSSEINNYYSLSFRVLRMRIKAGSGFYFQSTLLFSTVNL